MALFFFSGKGGVGKTHLSASLCEHLSNQGRRVLLVEFSKFAQYSNYFDREVGFAPLKYKENFFISSWTGLDCLGEYAQKVLRSQKAADLFFKVPLMRKFSEVAPGLKEIAVLGKITSDYRDNEFNTDFDDIVFDCPASGHFLSMLKVPESLRSTVGMGPMKTQCDSILEALKNRKDIHFALVEDGAEFSKVELKETEFELLKIIGKKPLNIISNKSSGFPLILSKSWLSSIQEMSSLWSDYQWK